MRKLLLNAFFMFGMVVASHAQTSTGACNTFSSTTGLSKWHDPSTKVSYSVANNELTIIFTNNDF